jgi:ADP-heptose:LPS heptosyltransferase
MRSVLVIKHGALGDVVLALGGLAAIRRHHAGDRLVLLAAPPYAALLRPSGWVDDIWTDARAPWWRLGEHLARRRAVAAAAFARVYDLQGSARTAWYRRLWPLPAAAWCRDDGPPGGLHARERLERQLAKAGITDVPAPDVGFLDADLTPFRLPEAFALLVPGSAATRPEKRWPDRHWRALGRALAARRLPPVLLGGAEARAEIDALAAAIPGASSLAGRTGFAELAALGRAARLAVGNDTGPVHLLAAAGCPVLTLFGPGSDPARSAPGWPDGRWLRAEPLARLAVATVLAALPQRA